MAFVRIYTGSDYRSHFEELRFSFRGDEKMLSTVPQAITRVMLLHPCSISILMLQIHQSF
ncbi:MAG: hypothetical protein HY695_29295 [Deltaproteobacteria bacterium]|nr:hypothetical protein [Deltaproteobacteria bacterium]